MAGNYQHSFFDYSTLEPKDSWICKQEDVAAVMLIPYSALSKFSTLNIQRGGIFLSTTKSKKTIILWNIDAFGAYVPV
jgi:hypothetical protein